MPPAFVRLVNRLPEQFFRGKYHTGHPLAIPPSSEVIVPWDTACFLCGDPYLLDVSPREAYRSQQLMRLQVYYGCTDVDIEDVADRFPQLDCLDVDGTPILMIIHDPKGLHAPGAPAQYAGSGEIDMLREQVRAMQHNHDALLALLNSRETAQAAQVSPGDEARDGSTTGGQPSDDVAEDAPRKVRNR